MLSVPGLQVTIEYLRDGGHLEPLRVHTLLISTQHSPDISLAEVQDELMKHVVAPVIPQRLLTPDTQYFLNPSKRWWTPSACQKHSLLQLSRQDMTGCLTSVCCFVLQASMLRTHCCVLPADRCCVALCCPPVRTCCWMVSVSSWVALLVMPASLGARSL